VIEGATTLAHTRLGEVLLEGKLISRVELRAAVQAQRVDRLRGCALFASLSESDLVRLSEVFEEVTCEDGEVLIEQDEADDHLYVIASGELEVFRVEAGVQSVPVTRLGPGEPAGEMGFVSRRPRSASVRSMGRSELLRASFDALRAAVEAIP